MRSYNIYFRKEPANYYIECRQCSHDKYEDAVREAELYKAWAEFHYKSKIAYAIYEQ